MAKPSSLILIFLLCFLFLNPGCGGGQSSEMPVIVLKRPGSESETSKKLRAPAMEKSSPSTSAKDTGEDTRKSVFSGEGRMIVDGVELEALKHIDYDKYIEYKTVIKTAPQMTGKMLGRIKERLKSLSGDIRNSIRNKGEKSLEIYKRRFLDLVLRFIRREKSGKEEIEKIGLFLKKEFLLNFKKQAEKNWVLAFKSELTEIIRQDSEITAQGSILLKFLNE